MSLQFVQKSVDGTQDSITPLDISIQREGSETSPSITWSTDTNTGIYHSNADQVAISCGGTINTVFTSSVANHVVDTLVPKGTRLNPGLRLNGITAGGLYGNSNDEIKVAINDSDITSFKTDTITHYAKTHNDSQPFFQVSSSGTQSIAAAVTKFTTWSTPSYNRGFTSWTSSVLTIETAGTYLICAQSYWAINESHAYHWISLNGDTGNRVAVMSTYALEDQFLNSSCCIYLAAGTTLELTLYRTATVNAGGSGTANRCLLSVAKLF